MRKLFKLGVSRKALGLLCLVIAFLISACASSGTPATGATTRTTPAATSTAAPQTPPSATPGADGSPPMNTLAAALVPMEQRKTGDVENITFLIGEGSEATFTVEEQISRLPLPNDAVVRTTAISGELHLDGRPSVIRIDLHQLSSDQRLRDRYVRDRMFPNDPIATFAVTALGQLPDGFTDGETVAGPVTGLLTLRGITVPLSFELEARDDGDVIFVLGRTTFTWSDFEMRPPNIAGSIQVTDEVTVEILLAARPFIQPGN